MRSPAREHRKNYSVKHPSTVRSNCATCHLISRHLIIRQQAMEELPGIVPELISDPIPTIIQVRSDHIAQNGDCVLGIYIYFNRQWRNYQKSILSWQLVTILQFLILFRQEFK